LIIRGEVDRRTRDLDFFGLTSAAVDRLVPAVDGALRAAGLVVRHVQSAPGFARLIVERDSERTEVDLGADARLFPAEPGQPAPTLSGEELAVDKVLAIFGRAEARDFADLMAVEPRYGLGHLFISVRLPPRRIAGSRRMFSRRCLVGSGACDVTSSSSTTLGFSSSGARSNDGGRTRSSWRVAATRSGAESPCGSERDHALLVGVRDRRRHSR